MRNGATDGEAPALVVGIGNPLRGDDGAGQAVVKRLAARGVPAAALTTCLQLTPELAAALPGRTVVVFIDAARTGAAPGNVRVRALAASSSPRRTVNHHFSAETVLALGRRCFGAEPSAWMVEIEAGAFDTPDRLTPAVRAAIPAAARAVSHLLASPSQPPSPRECGHA